MRERVNAGEEEGGGLGEEWRGETDRQTDRQRDRETEGEWGEFILSVNIIVDTNCT